jgi:hypothetical protein
MNRNPNQIFLMVLSGMLMVFGGFILLLPGLCGLVLFPTGGGLGPESVMLWLLGVGIFALGVWLIAKAYG